MGLARKGVYPGVVTPDAFVVKGVPKNPGLSTRIGSHVFFVSGEENYAHTSVPRRRKKGRELLETGKITVEEAEPFFKQLNPAKAHLRSHPDHKAEILCYIAAVKAKGLPQHGKERSHGSEEVALQKLAAAIGLDAASSICRHLRRCKLVKRKRQAYAPSRFEQVLPEGSEQFEGQYYRGLKLKDLQRVKLPVKFREDAKGRHYYHSQAWLRHPLARVPKNALVVFEYLQSRGLLQMRHGKMVFEIPISLRQISRGTSLHPETCRRAICFWEGKDVYARRQKLSSEVLRFVRGKREKYIRADGSMGYRRKPSRIIYVAENKFTLQHAEEEMVRLITAAQQLRNHDPIWRAKAEDIHGALVRAWVNTERHVQTLWAESRKRMAADGIPQEVVDALVPEHPPP